MKQIKQTIELALYGYTPNEFLPIFVEGKLQNKSEYISYRIKRAITHKTLL
jgi:hypothetical protein